MANYIETIDVNVSVRVAYNQWTQFETFPEFMEGVESVKQIDDTHTHWRANISGDIKEWDAEITEQTPDHRVAWNSTSGADHAGVVTFHRLNDEQTRVTLQIEYNPEGIKEHLGSALGVAAGRMSDDLANFKQFIETRHEPTGAWRQAVVADKE